MLWNQKDLPQPPINTYKSLVGTLDLTKLRNALQDGIKHFKDDEFLSNETALLSRILYRMKTKFRSSKDFKLMEKLCRSLNIYFSVNIGRHLRTILEMTPKSYRHEIYLPTKNTLNFILVRLQGLAKLMEKIYDTCLIIASELNQRFFIGHFWKLFLILFALVSRISILVKYNTKFICDLYGKLLPNSCKLENTGKNWLPEGYILPSDLRSWMSVNWVYEDEFVDLTFEPENEIINFFNLVQDDEDDDVVFCDEYILLDKEDRQIFEDFNKLSPIKETLTRNRMRGFSINEDDIGEEIEDIIELNSPIKAVEENAGDPLKISNKSSQIEDTGEEMPFSLQGTSQSKFFYENHGVLNKTRDKNSLPYQQVFINLADDSLNLNENHVFSVPSTPSGEQELTDNSSDIIVLEDTVKKKTRLSYSNKTTNKKKNAVDKKTYKKSVQKATTDNNMNKVRSKRKLEFDGNITNEKRKITEETKKGIRANDNGTGSINRINDSPNKLDENSIFSPSTPSGKQELNNNSGTIVLKGTKKKNKSRLSDDNKSTNKKRKLLNKKKSKKFVTGNNTNDVQISEPTSNVPAKRKLEFDRKTDNKKRKIEETTQNEIVLKSPKKGKHKSKKEFNKKYQKQDSSTEALSKQANFILQDHNLNFNKTIFDSSPNKKSVKTKKAKKHSKKEINLKKTETNTSCDLSVIFLNQEENILNENKNRKQTKKKHKKNKPAEQVEQNSLNMYSNNDASVIFVDGDVSFSKINNDMNIISTKPFPKKSKSPKKKKLKKHSNNNARNIGLDTDTTLSELILMKGSEKKSKRSFITKKVGVLKDMVKKSVRKKKLRKTEN